MSSPKKLVLFVEGPGDRDAVPVLVKRLLTEHQLWGQLVLDVIPFMVGEVGNLVRQDGKDWVRWLQAAAKSRKPLGAVLLVVDGDVERIQGKAFCASEVARYLSKRAKDAGGGSVFSVATVFALCEYESWLIAGVESLAGKPLPDGRPGVQAGTVPPPGDLEKAPRDAKGWLGRSMVSGYKPTTDQKPLTELVDLGVIRSRGLRSFRRLGNAIQLLANAIGSGRHIVSPPEGAS